MSDTLVVTPEARLSFPFLFTPKPPAHGSEKPTYGATFLLPPGFDRTRFRNAMNAAILKKFNEGCGVNFGLSRIQALKDADRLVGSR